MFSKKIRTFSIVAALLAVTFLSILFAGYSAYRRAEDDFSAQRYAVAADSFAQAAKILIWRDDLWERAGISASLGNDPQKAIDYFQQASILSDEGWVALGSSYFLLSNFDQAVIAYQSGLKQHKSPELYRLLASTYRIQKNWSAERDALQNQILLDSNQDAYTYYRLGLLLTFLDSGQSLPNLLRASSLDPETDSAVQTLIAALDLSAAQPDPSQQMVTIGRALGLVSEWELSTAAFEKAIEFDAENAEAWAWLGEAKQQNGQSGSVELDKAVQLDHTSVIVRALRGLYWSRLEKYSQMLAEYLLAAEYDPTNPAWQTQIGIAQAKLGDLVAALRSYQHATELAPEDSRYWQLLAAFCAESSVNLDDIGLPAAEKAVELAPDDPSAMDSLGWTYFASGRYANAEKILSDVNDRFPEYLPAHIHLAMTYLAQGNRSAAQNKLFYVMNADPAGLYGKEAGRLMQQYFP